MSEDPSAGRLLREARASARLSQSEVGRRAEIAQSVVSAYESGRRDPALSTLVRLVAATGHSLVVTLKADPSTRPGLPDTPTGRRLRQRRKALLATAARLGAVNLRVFGSAARGEDRPDSDIDVLVDLAPETGLVGLGALERELSRVLGRHVDVVPFDSLRPRVKAEAEMEAIPL